MRGPVARLVADGLKAFGIPFSPDIPEKFDTYCDLLLEKNLSVNLTAIKEPEQVAALHFLDSAALLRFAGFSGRCVADIGSGAGFPGLVIKILEPSVRLTLIDSQAKRTDFLSQCAEALKLDGVSCVHGRAEELSRLHEYRERFDFSVSRAVARLNVLCELCLPFVKPGGMFVAMKSIAADDELKEAENAIKTLGAEFWSTEDYQIPGTDVIHRLLFIKKLIATTDKYPRKFAKISGSPL